MKSYDYIIAGGGAAGLSLLLNLLRSDLSDRSILICDKEAKNQNDRTWCFWADQPTGLEEIHYRTWRQIRFTSASFDKCLPLDNFRYHMIRGIDFYEYVHEVAGKFSNVTFIRGNVTEVKETARDVRVIVDDVVYSGTYLFDSIIRPGELKPDPTKFHFLKQHFLGWEIETSQPFFDPQTPTLFDFRTPQSGAMRFMYCLPLSQTRALIEYTLFSPEILEESEYENALRDYLANRLGISSYEITSVERGVIPMTDIPFKRREGQRVLNIGTKAGRVKPSTGYAFWRIQQDAKNIVHSLQTSGNPFQLDETPGRYHLFDTNLLQIMFRHPEDCAFIFTAMFKHNPASRLFTFLNEAGPLSNDLRVILSLPPWRFLQALIRITMHKI